MSKKRHRTPSSVADPGTAEAGQVPAGALGAVPGADGYGDPSALALSSAPPAPGEEAVVRRTADGWRVGDDELPDLTCAMVLADLLAAELPTEIQPAIPPAPAGPAGPRAADRGGGGAPAADDRRSARARADGAHPHRAGHRRAGRASPHPPPSGLRAAQGRRPEPGPQGHRHRDRRSGQRHEPAAATARGTLPAALGSAARQESPSGPALRMIVPRS